MGAGSVAEIKDFTSCLTTLVLIVTRSTEHTIDNLILLASESTRGGQISRTMIGMIESTSTMEKFPEICSFALRYSSFLLVACRSKSNGRVEVAVRKQWRERKAGKQR